jgi:sugar transferase (PEP-CTERM/EpsH1 system associated)
MTILMLTHRVPYPPDRGDRIRSFHLLKFLAARAEISLACTTTEPVATETQQILHDLCARFEICPLTNAGRAARAAWSLATGRSATAGYFWHSRLAATISDWARQEKFDAVLCYCSGMFRYTQLRQLAGAKLVVDLVDVDSQKWLECSQHARWPKSWLYRVESKRVARLEKQVASEADAVTVISAEEQTLFGKIAPGGAAVVAGNGVDLEYFRVRPELPAVEPHTCCFVGVLDYAPNVDGVDWFCTRVWPAVRASVPDAKFLIVGKSPNETVRRLAKLDGVELHPDVPDVRPYMSRSAVAIAPLRFARGVQNKVLEAMAMGKAVVATPQSLEGLHSAAQGALLETVRPEEWFDRIISLFNDRPQVAQVGRMARTYVEHWHSWEACLEPLALLFSNSVSTTSVDCERHAVQPRSYPSKIMATLC